MADLIQMLIDAGAIPSEPFDASSRYRGVPVGVFDPGQGLPPLPYVRRRFIVQYDSQATLGELMAVAHDRPELLAARALGDPLQYWRIADANGVTDPFELTDRPGRRVVIPGGSS